MLALPQIAPMKTFPPNCSEGERGPAHFPTRIHARVNRYKRRVLSQRERMLREEALRRALQHARDRRQRELDEVQEHGKALRHRLRELTDRSLALGSVHGRFARETSEGAALEPVAAPSIVPEASPVAAPVQARPSPAPVFTLPPPVPRKDEESHDKLLAALGDRHPEGFTVGQMKDLMEGLDGRAHSYDAAWALANVLLRARALE